MTGQLLDSYFRVLAPGPLCSRTSWHALPAPAAVVVPDQTRTRQDEDQATDHGYASAYSPTGNKQE